MRPAVEPELETLRDALSARAATSVRPGVAEIQQIVVGRELLARTRS